MTDVAPTIATPEQVREAAQREAEANLVASLANSVTAVYGISGSGKSSLADTAAEYNWEVHKSISMCYALDPGGFGTKRLALIKAGIMRVWRPTNHVNFFETMELISMGGFAEHVIDPETGYADPNVRIVMPRGFRYTMIGPCGHAGRKWTNELQLNAEGTVPAACSECGTMYAMGNCQRIERTLVRNRMFNNVGLRIYDSISAESDLGLILELPTMSAKGTLPKSSTGGSALGSADALESGGITYGTGSMAQVGFMQNRAYGWLINIGKIPDQRTPPVCIFGVEQSKDDDETGGLIVLGPRIAGRARTGAVPGWVGNCVHAVQEADVAGNMRHRLYLKTHVDPKDPRKIPYLAKHRGVPRGMPEFLEDPWEDTPDKRAAAAWSVCSLNHLFRLIDAQVVGEIAALRLKYPNAPGFTGKVDVDDGEDVIEVMAPRAAAGPTPMLPGVAGAAPILGPAVAAPPPPTFGGQAIATRRRGAPIAGQGVPQPLPVPQVATLPVPAPVPPPVQPPSATAPVPSAVPPPAQAPVVAATPESATGPAAPVVVDQPAAAPAMPAAHTGPTAAAPTSQAVAGQSPAAPPVPTATPGPDIITGPIARRRPRPPVS